MTYHDDERNEDHDEETTMVKILIFGHALREVVEDPEVEIDLNEPTSLRELLEGHPDFFEGLMPFLQSHQLMLTIIKKANVQLTCSSTDKLSNSTTLAEGALKGSIQLRPWHPHRIKGDARMGRKSARKPVA